MTEPTYEAACRWWRDISDIWTPVGWKDHFFRFNVLWNGSLLADPATTRTKRSHAWKGQGVHLAFAPAYREHHMGTYLGYLDHDDGTVNQGWNDGPAPVLWSEWAADGVLLRQEVFAHIPGGGEVKSGIEPLFAWVRLSIHDLSPALPLEDTHGFNVLMYNTAFMSVTMNPRDNVRYHPDRAHYPRPLSADGERYDAGKGLRILEPDGGVRLGVAPGQKDCIEAIFTAQFTDSTEQNKIKHPCPKLYVRLPARKGAHVDLLVPMIPAERTAFDRELALGRDRALRETARYWSKIMKTPTRFEVPEAPINEILKHSLRINTLLAEKDPASGKYCKILGSWEYSDLWSTNIPYYLTMLMDTFGCHGAAEKYFEIFKDEQGQALPPGDSYAAHPGYLATPAAYRDHWWITDHGAILHAIAMHGLLSGDRRFVDRYTGCVVKACDFLREARKIKNHGGVDGLLPPAVATDNTAQIQAVWSIGWNYLGLCSAVRLLRSIGHPRAEEFAQDAAETRDVFRRAFRERCRTAPVWKDSRGRKHILPPVSLACDTRRDTRHPFYLDAGPLMLVFAGLLDADEPAMKDLCLWFREGPQRRFNRGGPQGNQVAVLDHEMSSCEPSYSWNVFHSHQLGERARFLEGMYSLFAGSISRKTGISCEERDGVAGEALNAALALYLARLAVIDDQVRRGELHLLRLMPAAWVKPGAACAFENVPTEFGPVTLLTRRSRDGKTLDVIWRPEFRRAPEKVLLHRPPGEGLTRVRINGRMARGTRAISLKI